MQSATTANTARKNTLRVLDDGFVTGGVRIVNTRREYAASGIVTTYDFQRDGSWQMNHVPHAVLIKQDGTICNEQVLTDTQQQQTAIDRAIAGAESLYEDADLYI